MSPMQNRHDMSFGELLSEGLRRSQSKLKNMGAIEREIAIAIDYSERTIQNWKAGRSLPHWEQLEYLIRYCTTHGSVDRTWVEQVLAAYAVHNANRRYDHEKAQKLLAGFPVLSTVPSSSEENANNHQFNGQTQHESIGVASETSTLESPYKGLQFFDIADTDLFYGREQLTAELVADLHQTRFLAVVGASGSGKSSLIRAGLLASLQRGHIPGCEANLPKDCEMWPVYLITPNIRPLESLAIALTRNIESVSATSTLLDDLYQDARSLHFYNSRLLNNSSATHVVIVVDQFEELFTLCRDSNEQRAFIDALLTAALDYDRTIVVIAMRADFYAHCARFEKLRTALDKYQKYIGAMQRPELQRAIEAPAAQGQWILEAGLVQQMLDDVSDETGALPLLSHALDETWKHRRDRQLTLSGYITAGGVKGAIAQSANGLYQMLSPEQQIIARLIFLRLTELGEGEQDTRRRVALTELQFQHTEPTQVVLVLKALADARLITTDAKEVQIMHEAVIREWPLLREWLADNRELLRLHRRLTESAHEWQSLGFDEGVLYRGLRLEQTLAWANAHSIELNNLEQKFIQASRLAVESAKKMEEEARERELEQQRMLAEEESKRAKLAEERAKEAIVYAKEKEQSAKQLRTWRNFLIVASFVSLLLALLAGSFSIQSTHNAVLADSQRGTAVAAQATAEANRAIALKQQSLAQAQATVAAAAQATAEVSALRANAERLAIQAPILSDGVNVNDRDLALLLASHAVTMTWLTEGYVLPNADLALRQAIDLAQRNQWQQVIPLSHSAAVFAVVYSPDGQQIASAGADQIVHLWNAKSGKEIRQFLGHSDQINAVIFSPDGKQLVSADEEGTIRLWEIATGAELLQLTGHTQSVASIAFRQDGKQIVSAGADGTVRLWDVASGQEVRHLVGHLGAVTAVAFSPNGQLIVSAGADNTVRLWNANNGQEIRQLLGLTQNIRTVTFSPDGEQIAGGGVYEVISIWRTATGKELRAMSLLMGGTWAVDFSADSQQVVSASVNGTISLSDVSSEKEVQRLVGHNASVRAAMFSPDGQQIVSASEDGTVRIWQAPHYQPTDQLLGHTGSIRHVAYSPDGKQIISASEDTTIGIWDRNSGQAVRQLTGHDDSVRSALFSPDGKLIVSASEDATIRLWDAASGKEIRQLLGHEGAVWSAVFSPDGQLIASGGQDTTVRLWDGASGRELRQLKGHASGVWSVSFSPKGQMLASADEDGVIWLWEVVSGKKVHKLLGHQYSVWLVFFSPDGQQLVSAGEDGTIRIWDVASGKEVRQLLGHTSGVRSVAFSSNGQQLVSASADKTVRIWDVASGREIRQLIGHTERILSVTYSPDGRQIASAGADTTICLWEPSIEKLLAQAQTLIQRNPPILTAEERQQYGIE